MYLTSCLWSHLSGVIQYSWRLKCPGLSVGEDVNTQKADIVPEIKEFVHIPGADEEANTTVLHRFGSN